MVVPGTEIFAEIEFLHESTERVRGYESVRYRVLENGGLSVEIHSISLEPRVVRDASYLLKSDYTPAECYAKVETNGRFAGSGWYGIKDEVVEMAGRGSDGAHVRRSFPIERPVIALVSHAVSSDVMAGIAAHRRERASGERTHGIYLTSADPYGRTMPEWSEPNVAVDFVGTERFNTPIGVLDADHFLLHLARADGEYAPFQDLWCLRDTPVFLASRARTPTSTRYTLRSLRLVSPA